MTLLAKRGHENVLRALQYLLSGKLPTELAAVNAANSAVIQAYLAGAYVFGTDTALNFHVNRGSEISVDVAAGTYTSSELATVLNAAAAFTAVMTAGTAMGSYLEICVTARGAACSIELGDSSGWSVLGLRAKGDIQPGYTNNYYPLRDMAVIEPGFTNIEPAAYPALVLTAGDVDRSEYDVLAEYTIGIRLMETAPEMTAGDVLYTNLLRTALAIHDVLLDNRSLAGQVNDLTSLVVDPGKEIEVPSSGGVALRGVVDFVVQLKVQEE